MTLESLMKRMIGDRTIAEFSSACEISPTTISDLLYGDIPHFTEQELVRMAGNSYGGVTLKELKSYFMDDEPLNPDFKDLIDSIRVFVNAVRFQFEHIHDMVEFEFVEEHEYQLLKNLFNDFKKFYPKRFPGDTVDFGIETNRHLNNDGDRYSMVDISWVSGMYSICLTFAIIYNSEKLSLDTTIFDTDELYKYGFSFDENDQNLIHGISKALGYNYALSMKMSPRTSGQMLKPMSAEEKLLMAIFGEARQTRTIEGFGFYTPSIERLKYFCISHKNSLNELNITQEKLYNIYKELDDCSISRYCYWASIIIRCETGIQVDYFNSENTSCIMYPTKLPWEMSDYEKQITKKHLYSVLDRYAKELHTTIQKCYCVTSKRSENEFDDLDNI